MTRPLQDIGLSIKRLQMRHHRAMNAQLSALDITLVQWDALRHLHLHPEASLHDLAVLTFQTDQSFGTLAARLIARGLIERIPSPGRAVRHRLTAKGETLRAAGGGIVDGMLAASFAPLTERELATLDALLAKVMDHPSRYDQPSSRA